MSSDAEADHRREGYAMKGLGAAAAVAVLCASVTQPTQTAQAGGGQSTTAPVEPLGLPSTALPNEFDVLRSFGLGGPWAAYKPYPPRPKPPDRIDPEPSRWPWTGERDPYDNPGRMQPHRCAEARVDVVAESSDERLLACSAASHAIQRLGQCGISPRRPITVQIMSEVQHPRGGAIFGLLDTKREAALVTHEGNARSLVKDTPYAKLPQRDFYRSVIVHEVVHAVMHQNLKRPSTSQAAYEYPAYALQIESLDPDVRDEFLQSFDQAATDAGSMLFNDVLLLFDPYVFAARAYHHFKAAADACAHLRGLLRGEAAFIAPSTM
jgi:hypothetical protein